MSLERQIGVENGHLLIMLGNTLESYTYLPVRIQVLGSGAISDFSYCDPDYLKQWWPEEDLWMASKICEEESQGDPMAINDSLYGVVELSCGLFQLNTLIHKEYTCEEMLDPVKNIEAAVRLKNIEGWEAWWNSLREIERNFPEL